MSPLPLVGAAGVAWVWVRGNWKVVAVGALILLVLIGLWMALGWKRDAEKLAAIREGTDPIEAQRKANEAAMEGKLAAEEELRAAAESRELEARAQALQMADLARQFGAQAAALAGRQTEIRREIAALQTPQEYEIRIKRDLGLRLPEDMGPPGFAKEELAAIATAVGEYPVAMQRLDEVEKQVGSLKGQVSAQGSELQAVREQLESERRSRAALEQGYLELKGHYVTLYNSIGVRKRSPRCLWLWKCADNKLPVPSPAELEVQP